MPLSVGSKAPHFTLKTKNSNGLHDWSFPEKLERPLVLLFFPAAFSKVCTHEFCFPGYHSLKALKNLDIVAISTDSPFAQEAWCEENNMSLLTLSDYTKNVSRSYEVLLPDLVGLGPSSARAAFVIDTDGVICYSEQTTEVTDLPDFKAIVDCVKGLIR